jgi:hypothetical protein
MNHDAVRASLIAIRKSGYTEDQFEWLGCQEATLRVLSPETMVLSRPATVELANSTLSFSVYDDFTFMEQQLLKTISLIRSRVGVLSLTERFDSLPMWAHYGAEAKGYVMRFDDLDVAFPGDRTGSLNCLKAVRYVEDFVGMTHDPSTQDNLFFCKFQDWQYEREWRVVSPLSACEFDAALDLYLRRTNPSCITGVICGWNVAIDDVRSLAIDLRRVNPRIEVLVSVLDRGRVVLRSLR